MQEPNSIVLTQPGLWLVKARGSGRPFSVFIDGTEHLIRVRGVEIPIRVRSRMTASSVSAALIGDVWPGYDPTVDDLP